MDAVGRHVGVHLPELLCERSGVEYVGQLGQRVRSRRIIRSGASAIRGQSLSRVREENQSASRRESQGGSTICVHLPAGDAVEVGDGVLAGEPAVDGGGHVHDAAFDAGLPRRLRHLLQQQPRQQEMPWMRIASLLINLSAAD